MASVFKIHVTRYVNAAGRQVRKDTPEARPKRQKSRKWYGEYTDEQGLVRRVPLSPDKSAAQTMLNQLVQQAARREAGLFDQYEIHERRPLAEHVDEFERFLASKNNTPDYVQQTTNRIRCLLEGCDFQRLSQISAPEIAEWLARQRQERKRFSIQTSNFYLEAAKAFCGWLERHGRIAKSPLGSLKSLNVDLDRRHHRRSLSEDAFERLIAAAAQGGSVQEVEGSERALLYIVAAWTGYRRRELASLTRSSLKLDADLPMVQVAAGYSKRRRYDSQPLHPEVVRRLREWLADKHLAPQDPLFHLTTPGGSLRRTSKMMRADLAAARQQWLGESVTPDERERREASDFLTYCDADGLFADFHANRHTFISRLGRSGVSLLTAQKLARHSDPRLTANVYNHLDEAEKAAAIELMPGPKPASPASSSDVPVAAIVAGAPAPAGQPASTSVTPELASTVDGSVRNLMAEGELVPLCQVLSAGGVMPPTVIETTAPGLKNRGLMSSSGAAISVAGLFVVSGVFGDRMAASLSSQTLPYWASASGVSKAHGCGLGRCHSPIAGKHSARPLSSAAWVQR